MSTIALRRTAALLEVLGVFVVGPLVMVLLIRGFGLPVVNPLPRITAGVTDAELLTITRQIFVLLFLQYAGWFLLIIPINWWHRRRGPAAYGLTTAGRPWKSLLLAGVVAAALAAWPSFIVNLVDSLYDLGETVPWRQAIYDTSWKRWEFWLLMAVASFAFIPVVEELFYRGYCQRRLAEDWGDGPAILGTACLFVFSHSQYLILNLYNVSFVVGLLGLAIGLGVVFAWTRSLIPSMVAHAIINVPMTPFWQGVLLAVFLVVAIIAARPGIHALKHVFANAGFITCIVMALLGTAWAVAAQRLEPLQFVAVAVLVLAVVLEFLDRRKVTTIPIC